MVLKRTQCKEKTKSIIHEECFRINKTISKENKSKLKNIEDCLGFGLIDIPKQMI